MNPKSILLLPLLLLIAATGCEEPTGGSSALKKPAQFGTKPDSIPSDNNIPSTDDDERGENILTLIRLEANTKFAEGDAMITKPGKLQAVVPIDMGTAPTGTVTVNMTTGQYSFPYILNIGLPGIAKQHPYNRNNWGLHHITVTQSDPAGKPYPIEIQYVTYN